MPGLEPQARQENQFSITTMESGRQNVKIVDRLTVDDIFLHMVQRELYSIVTGEDIPFDVSDYFRDALLKERLTSR